jgi:sulfur carrier protein
MRITVNGQPRELPDGATLAALLAALGLAGQRVAFEVNGAIVPRSARDAHPLRDGDKVEVVTAIGGG